MNKQQIAELFHVNIDNISSFVENVTGNLRYVRMTSADRGELQQEIIVRVNLKKPVKDIGGWTSKLEYRRWKGIDVVLLDKFKL